MILNQAYISTCVHSIYLQYIPCIQQKYKIRKQNNNNSSTNIIMADLFYQNDFKLSVLHSWLQNNKLQQIAKASLNIKISKQLLQQYGDLSSLVQNKYLDQEGKNIEKDLKYFTFEQILQLRGNHQHKVKKFQNPILVEKLKRKYAVEKEIGIPARKKLWLQMTQYYQRAKLYASLEQLEICEKYSSIIQKDINRTTKDKKLAQNIRQVLYAFAKYNPYIGYIQGMNFIALFLLQQQKKQALIPKFVPAQTFFIFKHLFQQILPVDYYTNMKTVIAYIRIFYQLLHQFNNKIYRKMKQIQLSFEGVNFAVMLGYIFQQFVSIFSKDVSKNITGVIWDIMFMEGVIALFKAGIVMYQLLQTRILQCKSFEQYDQVMDKQSQKITDSQYFKRRMLEINLQSRIIEILKNKIVEIMEKQQKQQNQRNKSKNEKSQKRWKQIMKNDKNQPKSCNEKWNFCTHALGDNGNNYVHQILVFKGVQPVNIIPDYLEKLDKQFFREEKLDTVDSLLVGRMHHMCRPKSDTITESSMSQKTNNSFVTPSKNDPPRYHQSTPVFSTLSSSVNQLSTPYTNKNTTSPYIAPYKTQMDQYTEQKLRQKATNKINKKKGMVKSQSVIFMQQMIQNASMKNLLDLQGLDEMFE